MGTPDFAVPSLRELAAHHEVTLVVTRPDAVRGRGKKLEPSPVKAEAQRLGIPVFETKTLRGEAGERVLAEKPDVLCVAAYGALLPDSLLDAVPYGGINVHGSLLPRWRGAAPIQRAILAGDERVGISIMRMVHDMDAGAYCRQASVEVGDKPCTQIMAELAELGAHELVAALDDLAAHRLVWTEQDESLVTLSPKITKAEMKLDPAETARTNKLRVQASTDEAPARLKVDGKGVRVVEAVMGTSLFDGHKLFMLYNPGDVLVEQGRVFLWCSDGSIEVTRVKPDGKREMDAKAWASGLQSQWPHRHERGPVWGRI